MLYADKTYGISNSNQSIGNTVMWSHLPENYFKRYGRKLVDLDRSWVFDHNPYVERAPAPGQQAPLVNKIDLSAVDVHDDLYWQLYGRSLPVALSRPDEECVRFGFGQVALRHPRLYRYEDAKTQHRKVVLHVYSDRDDYALPPYENARRQIPGHVLDQILTRYAGWEIHQVGGAGDPKVDGCIDKRGLPIWDTVREIADAALFIGIDSGPMNLAACYPRIPRKIVLTQFDQDYLRTSFCPMNARFKNHQWLDWSSVYFNCSSEDAGVTYSYTKI